MDNLDILLLNLSQKLTLLSCLLPTYRSGSSTGSGAGGSFLRRVLPMRRTNSLGAERRPDELNILGCEGVVSTEYLLQKLKEAQANKRITKLELEDCILRSAETIEDVFMAVTNLLAGCNRGGNQRTWQYIKFMDLIRINHTAATTSMDAESESCSTIHTLQQPQQPSHGYILTEYRNQRIQLWDQMARYARKLPVMFQVKVEISEGTSLAVLVGLLQELQDENLARLEFGGALFACRKADIHEKMASLYTRNAEAEELQLQELIMISISFMGLEAEPVKNSTHAMVSQCLDSLTELLQRPNNNNNNKMGKTSKRDSLSHYGSDHSLALDSLDKTDSTTNSTHYDDNDDGSPTSSKRSLRTNSKRRPQSFRRSRGNNQNGSKSSSNGRTMSSRSCREGNCRTMSSSSSTGDNRRRTMRRSKSNLDEPDFDWGAQRRLSNSAPQGLDLKLAGVDENAHHDVNDQQPDFRWDKETTSRSTTPPTKMSSSSKSRHHRTAMGSSSRSHHHHHHHPTVPATAY